MHEPISRLHSLPIHTLSMLKWPSQKRGTAKATGRKRAMQRSGCARSQPTSLQGIWRKSMPTSNIFWMQPRVSMPLPRCSTQRPTTLRWLKFSFSGLTQRPRARFSNDSEHFPPPPQTTSASTSWKQGPLGSLATGSALMSYSRECRRAPRFSGHGLRKPTRSRDGRRCSGWRMGDRVKRLGCFWKPRSSSKRQASFRELQWVRSSRAYLMTLLGPPSRAVKAIEESAALVRRLGDGRGSHFIAHSIGDRAGEAR